jgi:hypothetical protein
MLLRDLIRPLSRKETCRTYPEGIIGLSLGFQPQEQPTIDPP